MISWKILRTTCLVILLIPVVHLVYLLSRDTIATLSISPDAWSSEIDAYARQDRSHSLPEHPIVVVGGRRVKLWRGLEDMLAPLPVLMRGLGDATVDDLIHNYARLIGYYEPRAVVLLPSSTEFHIRANKSPRDLVAGIEKLASLNAEHAASSRFYVITPLKTPMFASDDARVEETTRLLSEWAATKEHITVLDASRLLEMPDGRPNPAYYRADGINLNEHGYLRLTVLLQTTLEAHSNTLIPPKSSAPSR